MTPRRQPVLDRAQWVERFDLDEEVHALRRQMIDPDHRRIADRLDDALIFPSHVTFCPVSIKKAFTRRTKFGLDARRSLALAK